MNRNIEADLRYKGKRNYKIIKSQTMYNTEAP